MSDFRVYQPGERPDVEVRVDGAWWPAEVPLVVVEPVRLVGHCTWHHATGETQLGTFHEDDVRRDMVDRSYGREGCS